LHTKVGGANAIPKKGAKLFSMIIRSPGKEDTPITVNNSRKLFTAAFFPLLLQISLFRTPGIENRKWKIDILNGATAPY